MGDEEIQMLRMVVRNYSRATGVSITVALDLMVPMFLKNYEERLRESFKDSITAENSKLVNTLIEGYNDAAVQKFNKVTKVTKAYPIKRKVRKPRHK